MKLPSIRYRWASIHLTDQSGNFIHQAIVQVDQHYVCNAYRPPIQLIALFPALICAIVLDLCTHCLCGS
jgi:hypothetical protein